MKDLNENDTSFIHRPLFSATLYRQPISTLQITCICFNWGESLSKLFHFNTEHNIFSQ